MKAFTLAAMAAATALAKYTQFPITEDSTKRSK